MSKPRIFVTGANGQLGKELKEINSGYPQFDFIFLSREDMPIQRFELVRNFFKVYQPNYFINCAAYTQVDRAEKESELAFEVNGEAVGVLAAICKENKTKFIHISTDYVFDGKATSPYKEDFAPHPINIYGASKLEGERQAFQLNPESIIIRSSWVYSEFGKNFVKTMLQLMQRQNEISVVNDQFGSPTYAADLAEATLQIVSSEKWQPGIFHYCNDGIITWYDFAKAIAEISGNNCKINPIATKEYPTPAARPTYSALDTSKIKNSFGIQIKNWKESLGVCIERIKKHNQ
jgi:dTDP-4-dehydrorhamnose reductase